jgi:AhpD family alkylhydroperoxidase
MQTTTFNKRIYTLTSFKSGMHEVIAHLDDLRAAAHSKYINHAFAEKIMVVVSRVNSCRYCCYGHSRAALIAGVSETELQSLLALELKIFPTNEVVALTFAQHYAETNCQPDPAAWQRVVSYYGEETANVILAYLRMITFGNLLGNTFDALLSRMIGKPAPNSSLSSELEVLLGVFWVLPSRLILQLISKKTSNLVAFINLQTKFKTRRSIYENRCNHR